MLKFILEVLFGYLDDNFKGFEPENVKVFKLGMKQGTLFQSHCFGPVH